jgi:hypothetical protein
MVMMTRSTYPGTHTERWGRRDCSHSEPFNAMRVVTRQPSIQRCSGAADLVARSRHAAFPSEAHCSSAAAQLINVRRQPVARRASALSGQEAKARALLLMVAPGQSLRVVDVNGS